MKNISVSALIVDGNIFLGQNFFNDSREGRAITMIHESVVHRAFGRRDESFGGGDKIQGSKNITSKIQRYYRTIVPRPVELH